MRHRIVLPSLIALLLLSACSKQGQNNGVIGREVYNVMMPVGKNFTNPVHGKEVWFAVGAMNGEGKTLANGVAQTHVFADGASIVTVNLNIEPASKGARYVAWAQKPGDSVRDRLDVLLNPLGDARHVISADIKKDLRAETEIVVTLEQASGPSPGDAVVATGELKQQQR